MLAGVEPPGNARPTVGTAVVGEPVETGGVPIALDEPRAAARAEGLLAFGIVHVPDVAVANAPRAGDRARAAERRGRRSRAVHHLEIGMERREVQRHVRAEMFEKPV